MYRETDIEKKENKKIRKKWTGKEKAKKREKAREWRKNKYKKVKYKTEKLKRRKNVLKKRKAESRIPLKGLHTRLEKKSNIVYERRGRKKGLERENRWFRHKSGNLER